MAEVSLAYDEPKVEEWRPIKSLGGLYSASNFGRVMRSVGGKGVRIENRILRQTCDPRGRLCVYPTIDSKKHTRRVHCLIAEAFHGPCPTGHVVRHLDGNQTNNVFKNLAYGTMKDNMDDRTRHGRTAKGDDRHGRAKLTSEAVRQIRILCGTHTQRELGEMFGVTHQSISQVLAGRTWSHVE